MGGNAGVPITPMMYIPVTRSPHGRIRHATVRPPERRYQLGIAEATLAIHNIRTRVVNLQEYSASRHRPMTIREPSKKNHSQV